jgi:hypothetical protein
MAADTVLRHTLLATKNNIFQPTDDLEAQRSWRIFDE